MVKETVVTKKKSIKSRNIIQLLLLLFILTLLNIIASFLFTRFDLTSEKKYTLTPTTKNLLEKLPDVVYFKVYLSGDLTPDYKKLEKATRELLDEMRIYAGDNLQYEFIDPDSYEDKSQRNDLYTQLYKKGLQPTTLPEKNKETVTQKVIFPGAIVSFHTEELPLQILKEQLGAPSERNINASVEGLEYEIANAIQKLTANKHSSIAFIEGHGELDKFHVNDIANHLKNSYSVQRKRIEGKLEALQDFKAVIIAKPDSAFDEKDKFIIDQFVMKGGKVLWLIDPMVADMDSLAESNEALATARELNLDDMLFRYGARLNYDLVQDLQAAPIPMVIGYSGGRPQQSMLPWYYFPLIFPESKHPIVNNLNAVRFQFASTIDTVGPASLKKTVLLSSSKFTRVVNSPARISLELMRKEPDEKLYSQGNKILAALIEGTFTSNFTNRIPPVIAENKEIGFKENSVPTKMAVISDGDLIRNDYKKSTESVLPLGFDRYTGQMYGNKNFLLNVIDYLCDDEGLMSLRSKQIRLRLLDKTLSESTKSLWKIINTSLPVLLILIFGIIKLQARKIKYAK